MASTKKAPRKVPEGLVVITQRLWGADVATLKKLGEVAGMPWGEVLRRLVKAAVARAVVTPEGGVTINNGRMK
jgi:hypothetical protein